MSQWLGVLVDDQVQLEFDHAKLVPQPQLDYLEAMDARMDGGIELDGEHLAEPDSDARVKFVARNLAMALAEGNDKLAIALCTYLGVRRPGLKQLKISSGELGVTVDLDYENDYQRPAAQPQVVTFDPNMIKHDS
jgi:hypothetical protein